MKFLKVNFEIIQSPSRIIEEDLFVFEAYPEYVITVNRRFLRNYLDLYGLFSAMEVQHMKSNNQKRGFNFIVNLTLDQWDNLDNICMEFNNSCNNSDDPLEGKWIKQEFNPPLIVRNVPPVKEIEPDTHLGKLSSDERLDLMASMTSYLNYHVKKAQLNPRFWDV